MLTRDSVSVREEPYDPFAARETVHKTSDYAAFAHMIKGCLGAGVLAMPLAFSHSGWILGLICTIFVGGACAYCINLLVFTVWEELQRKKVPVLTFSEACEASFLSGPEWVRKASKYARLTVETFLVFQLLGICAVYVLFVATTVQEALHKNNVTMDVRLTILCLLPILIMLSLIKTLKFLSPLSILANIFMLVSIAIVFYYLFEEIHYPQDRHEFQEDVMRIPLFFGIVVFSLEGIGVVVSIENTMQNPRHFIYFPSILNISMVIVTLTYLFTGFCGYLRYGDDVNDNITTNLPFMGLGLASKICMCIGILFSYCIQFYPPMEIVWSKVKLKVPPEKETLYNILLRISLVLVTVIAAIIVPNLGIMMSLMGSLCLSVLGFIFPPIMEYFTFNDKFGAGFMGHRLIRTIFFIIFGLFAMSTGVYSNICELLKQEEYVELVAFFTGRE